MLTVHSIVRRALELRSKILPVWDPAHVDRLAELLTRLPAREREILALKYGADMTNRDIAKITKLSESNVGTILHRTLQGLRSDW